MAAEPEKSEEFEGLDKPLEPSGSMALDDATESDDAGDDPRLASGIPETAHADELDFIEMTGLTRPTGSAFGGDMSGPPETGLDLDPVEVPAPSPEPAKDDAEPEMAAETGVSSPMAGHTAEPEPAVPTEPAPDPTPEPAPAPPAPPVSEPAPPRARATEAADALDSPGDDDDASSEDALARALEAFAAAPARDPSPPPPDVDTIASKVRDEILDGLREDLSALRTPPPPPEPPVHASPANPSLQEAERLVQELQEQPRDAGGEPQPRTSPQKPPASGHEPHHEERRSVSRLYAERRRDVDGYLAAYTGEPARPESDEPEVEVDFSNDPPKHRHRTITKKQRAMRRFLIVVFAMLLLGSAAYIGYQYAEPYLQTAGTLYREAEQLEVSGKAREASNRYRAFLNRYPNDPRAPEALFRAGFVLQIEDAAPVSPRALADSVNLFEEFVEQYPDHDKAHRARTLRGILLHRMGEHEQAITALRDPALQMADPTASLPVMRTLAQAYQAIGDYDSARSEYLKAVSMQGNYGADKDFEALAEMYKDLAERTGDEAERREYTGESIAFFEQASLVPGISRDRIQALEREAEFLRRELAEAEISMAHEPAEAFEPPAYRQLLEADGDPTAPAVEPGEAVSVLDGLDATLPGTGLGVNAIDGGEPAPAVSADPVFDDTADESVTEDDAGLPADMPALDE